MEKTKILSSFLSCAEAVTAGYDFSETQRAGLRRCFSFLREHPMWIEKGEDYYERLFSESACDGISSKICGTEDEASSMLFAAIYLSRLWVLPDVLSSREIPAEYAAGAAWHYRDLLQRNHNCYGSYGFRGMYRDGMWGYLWPTRFTLGCLNFEIGQFHAPYCVYRNEKDGQLLPVANEGGHYLADGRPWPKGSEREIAFVAEKNERDGVIVGHTFDGDGHILTDEIRLDPSIWRAVLSEGDDVLWVYIPSSGPLNPEAVEESLAMAREFFAAYYPSIRFRAFVCSSWLLDTGLRAHLRADANILAFQERFRIVLSRANPMALYWNVFGVENPCPLSELVPQNRFQERMLQAAKDGEVLYSGNGFILW